MVNRLGKDAITVQSHPQLQGIQWTNGKPNSIEIQTRIGHSRVYRLYESKPRLSELWNRVFSSYKIEYLPIAIQYTQKKKTHYISKEILQWMGQSLESTKSSFRADQTANLIAQFQENHTLTNRKIEKITGLPQKEIETIRLFAAQQFQKINCPQKYQWDSLYIFTLIPTANNSGKILIRGNDIARGSSKIVFKDCLLDLTTDTMTKVAELYISEDLEEAEKECALLHTFNGEAHLSSPPLHHFTLDTVFVKGKPLPAQSHLTMVMPIYCSTLDTLDNDYPLEPIQGFIRKLFLLRDAAEGMKHLHANGYVHRDIKPANIFVKKGTERHFSADLSDFGFTSKEEEELFAGTPEFLSPESYQEKQTTKTSDLWAFGMTMYIALYREYRYRIQNISCPSFIIQTLYESDNQENITKFESLTQEQVNEMLSFPSMELGTALYHMAEIEVKSLIRSLLQINPSERPSAEHVVSSLEEILRSLPLTSLQHRSPDSKASQNLGLD